MRLGRAAVLILCLCVLGFAVPAGATTVTSSFVNFVYSYSVTPAPGEAVRDFHVYAGVNEGDISHYYNVVMPAGWQFTIIQLVDKIVLTWWTTGAPLPVGAPAAFGFVHYCAPCCHSWFTTDVGTDDPAAPSIDGSWNHPDWPCNIPPEFAAGCAPELGGVLAPIYPDPTALETSTWGNIKVLYR